MQIRCAVDAVDEVATQQATGENSAMDDEDPAVAEFNRVCTQLAGFDPALDVEYVDGCFTALIAGPRSVLPGEWMPVVFGDAFARAFADPDDVQRASAGVFGRWNQIAGELDPRALGDEPDVLRLRPLIGYDDEDLDDVESADRVGAVADTGASHLPPGSTWAAGFLHITRAFEADWTLPPGANEHDRQLLLGCLSDIDALALAGDSLVREALLGGALAGHGRAARSAGTPSHERLIDDACLAAQDLRMFWLARALRPAPRRVDKLPGRNDPCPCGSGKKYKKCCAA